MKNNFYPPSPNNIPTDLLKLPDSYKTRVVLVLLGIILFVLLYFLLVALAGYMIYLAVVFPLFKISLYTILAKMGCVAIAVMFFIFTLKFLFKKQNFQNPTNVQLKEKDYPELFQFIRNLCDETGAPFPKKVIVNEQINAAVFYDKPLLSMFLPVRKNLLIGLGLVNSLNLSEFKAVLAHEFGHFSQRSMKLGSYVYMANRIIHDMVYNRDGWDETLDEWSQSDFRIAIFAWILKLLVWVIRHFLMLVYKGINLLHASLSRQMEFNADLVAVSVTGSDQIVNGLSKLMRSSAAMNMAMQQLLDAADHKMYSKNLFFHQFKAEHHLKENVEGFENRTPSFEVEGKSFIFSPDEKNVPDMYASHPPNFDREKNAKARFVEGVTDERSPWILFKNSEELKQMVTAKLYESSQLKPTNAAYQDPEKIDQFIQAELKETSFDEKYHDTYTLRMLHELPLENAEQIASEKFSSTEKIKTTFDEIYGETLANEMNFRKSLYEQEQKVFEFVQNPKSGNSFEFRNKNYPRKGIEEVLKIINEDLEKQHQGWTKEFDDQVFWLHLAMLSGKNMEEKNDFLKRCEFQNTISRHSFIANHALEKFNAIMNEVFQKGNLDQDDVYQVEANLTEIRNLLFSILQEAEAVEIPNFEFMDEKNLRNFLLQGQLIRAGNNLLNNTWINKFSEQTGMIQKRSKRLYWKSLGSLIAMQEAVAEKYFAEKTEI